ncbi:HAD family hydrolase, partial [Parolsenella catena]
MAFEIIALDMDGTLLDSRKRVLPSSVAAIERAAAAGKTVAICSGRCPVMVTKYRDELPGVRYAICCA